MSVLFLVALPFLTGKVYQFQTSVLAFSEYPALTSKDLKAFSILFATRLDLTVSFDEVQLNVLNHKHDLQMCTTIIQQSARNLYNKWSKERTRSYTNAWDRRTKLHFSQSQILFLRGKNV